MPALPFFVLNLKKKLVLIFAAYQQPIKYNFAVTREVLKHVYTAERLQPPTSLGAVLGTYSTLWARARSIGYWRDVVRSGEYARLGVYALEAYGIFKVRFLPPLTPSLF
jgi:F-type H+-transporting ATPase subunit g